MNFTPDQFVNHLMEVSEEVRDLIEHNLPSVLGVEARNHFQDNFQNEGFTDRANDPWEEVKRRLDPRIKGARATRKILTGDTGDLGESIDFELSGAGKVTIYSDKVYADAHNEGTANAGRNRDVTIPQRKFMGESEALNNKVIKKIESMINNTLK